MDYNSVIAVTQQTPFIIAVIFVWVSQLIILALVFSLARVSSGKHSKRLIGTPAFLWAFLIAFFWNILSLVFFIVIPLWAKL